MTYYIHLENNKIISSGECPMGEPFQSIEVSEELHNNFVAEPDKYIWDIQSYSVIENPNYEADKQAQEREELNHLSLTKREVFLALYKDKGITPEQIKASITSPEALIEFEYATEYFRGNPLIDAIGTQLGYTSDDLDYLFQNGELP